MIHHQQMDKMKLKSKITENSIRENFLLKNTKILRQQERIKKMKQSGKTLRQIKYIPLFNLAVRKDNYTDIRRRFNATEI